MLAATGIMITGKIKCEQITVYDITYRVIFVTNIIRLFVDIATSLTCSLVSVGE